jgi:6-phosphogluconolactonase (cycloisomerase 2 family)
VSAWEILPSGGTQYLQEFHFLAPGQNTSDSHAHEALVDPTDSFIVVPDLGANLLRVFSIDNSTSLLTEAKPFVVSSGGGPRHGAFMKTCSGTYFFLVAESGQTITSYKVTYGNKQLSFDQVYQSNIYGDKLKPDGASAAECYLSPCQNYLLTSTRSDSLFTIDNFDTSNSTKIPSDSLEVWKIDHATGKLDLQQIAPAGGRVPRQFSLNKNGTLAAVGLQSDSRVVIIERREDGTFGDFVADIDIPGMITSVIFDE